MSTTSKVLCVNNAVGTLQGLHSASTTEFALSGSQGDKFPTITDGDCFYMTVEDTNANLEVVKVTARTGSLMTVVRAQGGTTAREWANGTEVSLRATAELFNDKLSLKENETRWTSEKTTLNAAIDAKLPLAGGAITGNLSVAGTTTVDDISVTGDLNVTGTVTASVAWSSVTGKPSFATVATSGSYNDLSNKPSTALVGEGKPWFGDASNVPSGYLLCDGSAISRTTYSALFAVLGTAYGAGDGSTTFNLPNGVGKTFQGAATRGHISAGLPNITGLLHGFQIDNVSGNFYANGAFSASGYGGQSDEGFSSWTVGQASFNAASSNAIYGNSSTVQPPAMAGSWIIKY